MKHIIPFIVLFFLSAFAFADDAKLSLLLEQDTVLVAHIDVAKIDTQGLVQNNKMILEMLAKANNLPSSKELTALIERSKTYLTSTLGINEAYLVANARVPFPFYAAIPKTEQLKVETFKKVLADIGQNNVAPIIVRETADFVFLVYMGGAVIPEATVNMILPKKPVPRPDLTEAFKEVQAYPIQVVVAFPDYVRKVIRDTKPVLPKPWDNVDIMAISGSFRWQAVGIDPSKPEFHQVVETKSNLAASTIYEQIEKLLSITFEELLCHAKVQDNNSISEIEIAVWKHLSELLTPELFGTFKTAILTKPQGSRLETHWDSKKFSELTGAASALLIALTKDFAGKISDQSQQQKCHNNLKQIILAFHNYHDSQGAFPPVFTVDKNGKPLHSWRVLILPYMEQMGLYESIRLNEPWDSEHNKQFHDKMPNVFRCPDSQGNPKRDTVYCFVVGKETLGKTDGKGLNFSKITDGTSNTIGVAERKTPVCWMAPADILQEDAYLGINKKAEGIGSGHQNKGTNVGVLDGSVRFLKEDTDLKTLKALLTIGGGETVPFPRK
jgi:hypothetical protein